MCHWFKGVLKGRRRTHSSWAVGKHHHGLNGKSGAECTVLENRFKKSANMLKSSNKPKAVLWYGTSYSCACNLCYIPQPFSFSFYGNRLTATRKTLPTEIKRNLLAQGILASDWTYTCWHVKTLKQKVQNFLMSPEGKSLTSYQLRSTSFQGQHSTNHANNKTGQTKPEYVLGSES